MSNDLNQDLRQYTGLQDRILTGLGAQLADLARDLGRRLDGISEDNKDIGQRLAKIEGMQIGNAQELKDIKDDLKGAKTKLDGANDKVNKLENRIVRLETMIVPAVGLLSAVASSLATKFLK